jgi:predicted secreted protein
MTFVGTLAGCSPSPDRSSDDSARVSPDSLIGRFAGVLPCADCAGIRTELGLFAERGTGRPTRYEATETYLATRDGDKTFERSGRWTIMRGSADDPDATVYQLDFDQPQALRNFLSAGESEMRLLDRDQRDIASLTPHSLWRMPDDSRTNAMTLGENEAGRNIDVAHGTTIMIRLESNRSTGYRWSLAPATAGVLEAIGDAAYTGPGTAPGVAGNGGTETFTFRATQRGRQELRFEYRRPWEGSVPPARSLTYIITVP